MARLKIATYNINGVRARQGALLEWLEREKPDIACLQELKAPDEGFPQSEVERVGYGAIWHGQKSWNGVAILARGAQPEERRRGLPGDPDESQSRYLEADVHGLRVGCLYLPNGNPWPGPKFDYKLAWFAAFRRHAATLLRDGMPTILCGDYNVVPTDELDIYKASSWKKDALLQPESREAWFAMLEQGWTDAIRSVHGDARIYTFWDYFRKHWERDAGLRIDHLLLSPDLAPMLHDAGVDRWVRGQSGASDHAPTWVVLDTDGAGKASRATAKSARQAKPVAPGEPVEGKATPMRGKKSAVARKKSAERVDGGDPVTSRRANSTPASGKKGAVKKAAGKGVDQVSKVEKAAAKKAVAKRPVQG